MLRRKMLRDIRANLAQFFSIMLLSLIAMWCYTGFQANVIGGKKARNDFENSSNFADGWIYGADFNEEQAKKIAAISGIKDVQRRTEVLGKADEKYNTAEMYCYFQNSADVTIPRTTEGADFNADDEEGLWLFSRFAETWGIKVGDKFTVHVMGLDIEKEVKGFIVTPEYEYACASTDTDIEARKTISSYLKKKKGFILVSHDRVLLDSCIDHIISINRANIDVQRGNFSSWWANKQMQDNYELSENERLKKEIKHLSAAAKRTSEWSAKAEGKKIGIDPSKTEKSISHRSNQAAKSKKMMSRAIQIQSRQDSAIEEKKNLLKNIDRSSPLKLSPEPYVKDMLVSAADLAIYYGDKKACSGLDFNLRRGDRIAVNGKNGCGKSTLLKLICGQKLKYTGNINIGSQLKISYVPQDTSELKGDLKDYTISYGIDESLFKTILRKLDFERIQFEKKIEDLSEGQKKKNLIARSLCEKANLYVWDEPLNYIDIISRMQIEELLLKYNPTLIFVEHDSVFQNKIATKSINLL